MDQLDFLRIQVPLLFVPQKETQDSSCLPSDGNIELCENCQSLKELRGLTWGSWRMLAYTA